MIHNTFDKQIAINLSLENGIVNIDKLLACNDFETIKEGLNNYPLTINEYLKEVEKLNNLPFDFLSHVCSIINEIYKY